MEVASDSSLLQSCLSSSFSKWQSAIAVTLHEAKQKRDLPGSMQHEALAAFVLNSWEGALLRSQADKSDLPLKQFLHFIFDQLLVK